MAPALSVQWNNVASVLRPKDDIVDAILAVVDDHSSIELQDLYSTVAARLSLAGSELTKRSPNGMLAFQDQISWALTELTRDGTLRRPDRGVYERSGGSRIRIRDLSDQQAIDDSIVEFDQIGRDAFLEKYGFGEAREYFVVTDSGRYDSKAIFAAAWLREHGEALTPSDFSGGRHGAAGRLIELGYTVESDDRRSSGLARVARTPKPTADRASEYCPTCGLAMPASKICDFC